MVVVREQGAWATAGRMLACLAPGAGRAAPSAFLEQARLAVLELTAGA